MLSISLKAFRWFMFSNSLASCGFSLKSFKAFALVECISSCVMFCAFSASSAVRDIFARLCLMLKLPKVCALFAAGLVLISTPSLCASSCVLLKSSLVSTHYSFIFLGKWSYKA